MTTTSKTVQRSTDQFSEINMQQDEAIGRVLSGRGHLRSASEKVLVLPTFDQPRSSSTFASHSDLSSSISHSSGHSVGRIATAVRRSLQPKGSRCFGQRLVLASMPFIAASCKASCTEMIPLLSPSAACYTRAIARPVCPCPCPRTNTLWNYERNQWASSVPKRVLCLSRCARRSKRNPIGQFNPCRSKRLADDSLG